MPKPPRKRRARKSLTSGLNVGPTLIRLQRDHRPQRNDRETAKEIGISASRYSELKAGHASPTLAQLARFCRYFDVPLSEFLVEQKHLFAEERRGIGWRVHPGLTGRPEAASRNVAVWILRGEARREIAARVAASGGGEDPAALAAADDALLWMARGALTLGLVELVFSRDAREVQDAPLAEELGRALAQLSWKGRATAVHVVRNAAHVDFDHDPIAPFLIARVAHRVVSRFLGEHRHTYTLGIAGGIHVAAFVRSIGPESSPFPDHRESDRQFALVPLTLEPFHDHRLDPADSLVGDFFARAAATLGPPRVDAPSFKPFGYLEDRRVGALETDSVVTVRDHYRKLDVAIFGCGDRSDDGWLAWARKRLGIRGDEAAATDVCLNMLSDEGEPIPLPSHGIRREYLGVGLDEIQSLTARKDRLALLLASGASKGKPIALVTRAGCANAVVCDQAAARATLEAIASGAVPPAPASRSATRAAHA